MANNIGIILAEAGYYTELGSAISQGGRVRIKNLGEGVAYVRTIPAGDTTITPGSASSNAWPLNSGQEMELIVPPYPVAADTPVPAFTTIGEFANIVYSVVEES